MRVGHVVIQRVAVAIFQGVIGLPEHSRTVIFCGHSQGCGLGMPFDGKFRQLIALSSWWE